MAATFAPSDVVVVTSRGKRNGKKGEVLEVLDDPGVPLVCMVRFPDERGRHAYYPEELTPLESTNAAEAPARAIDGESQSAGRRSQNAVPAPIKEQNMSTTISPAADESNAPFSSRRAMYATAERMAQLAQHFNSIPPALYGDAVRFTMHNPSKSIAEVVAAYAPSFEPPACDAHLPKGTTSFDDWEYQPGDNVFRRFVYTEAGADGKTVSLDHCQYAHADGTVETVEMSLDLSAYEGLPLRNLDEVRSLVTALETIIAAEEA